MNRSTMIVLATSLLSLVACDPKPADPKPEDPATKNAAASATVAVPAPVPVTIADGDLATPADFEEVAEKAITKANYKAELSTLEADVAKD